MLSSRHVVKAAALRRENERRPPRILPGGRVFQGSLLPLERLDLRSRQPLFASEIFDTADPSAWSADRVLPEPAVARLAVVVVMEEVNGFFFADRSGGGVPAFAAHDEVHFHERTVIGEFLRDRSRRRCRFRRSSTVVLHEAEGFRMRLVQGWSVMPGTER
jgi:hypothetical protein